MSVLGSGVLVIDTEQVIAAAGALDALVAAHRIPWMVGPERSTDAGDADVSAAADLFVAAWGNGLTHLLDRQTARAAALRKTASAMLGVDVDVAYQLRAAIGTP